MAYCRFSSDDGKSDVYMLLELSGTWTIYVKRQNRKQFWLSCFNGISTRQEVIDKLLNIRSKGYHVPESALDRLREEIAEEEAATHTHTPPPHQS